MAFLRLVSTATLEHSVPLVIGFVATSARDIREQHRVYHVKLEMESNDMLSKTR